MAMHTATAAAPCAGRVFARLARANGAHRRHVGAQSARVPRRARDSARVSATATAEATADASAESAPDDLANAREVESAEGLRIVRSGTEGSDDAFELEFLLRVKGVDSDVWVPAALVADDVKRDYEAKWWKACREGDFDVVERMLKGGGEALASARDDDGRSALHYACGVGSEECVRAIIARGAEVDAKDKDSFTPLHIAAGYLHEKIVETLVRSGANPELEDATGRSPLDLVETLTINTPATTVTFARRSVLESIAKTLEQFVFEEVPPAAIKRSRVADDGSGDTEFLVEWLDDFGDQWVARRDVADDLVRDFENGLEYATVARAYEPPSRQSGPKKNRRKLVAWADGAPPTWEP
jgi:signal recognition particle 43 kDa protein